ncbi:MAG: PatB family C-S lyase [Rhodocyclaceae bacterium]|jgi:cystathionine beta-lyase|nr:PatB family C-S lyase [Rhodocyclaceae bacterium]
MFDFDHPIDRAGGEFRDSLKWNRYAGRDVIPLWVADMDFAAPPPVVEALHRRIDHGVFGYSQPWPSLVAAVTEHLDREYRWPVEPEWIVWLPGLVTGLNVACRAVGSDGDAVFTATPIYPPFLSAPAGSGRTAVTAPLVRDEEGWLWDWAATDGVLRTARPRLFLLCHPHNPVGRAWREDELWQVLALAEKHDMVVCSDEIHCDLILEPGRRHQPFATLSPAAARRSITLMAPSKTFNIPGLGCAFAVIPDPGLRRAFHGAMHGIVPHVNTLGLVACEAALRDGAQWRAALLAYLRDNARCVENFVKQQPLLSMASVEATYLAWIDARAIGTGNPQQFFEAAGVGLSDGADFGTPGFVRLNFGCPRALLEQALDRMAAALSPLRG